MKNKILIILLTLTSNIVFGKTETFICRIKSKIVNDQINNSNFVLKETQNQEELESFVGSIKESLGEEVEIKCINAEHIKKGTQDGEWGK